MLVVELCRKRPRACGARDAPPWTEPRGTRAGGRYGPPTGVRLPLHRVSAGHRRRNAARRRDGPAARLTRCWRRGATSRRAPPSRALVRAPRRLLRPSHVLCVGQRRATKCILSLRSARQCLAIRSVARTTRLPAARRARVSVRSLRRGPARMPPMYSRPRSLSRTNLLCGPAERARPGDRRHAHLSGCLSSLRRWQRPRHRRARPPWSL